MSSGAGFWLTRKPFVDVRCVEFTSEGAGIELSTVDTEMARGWGGGRLVAAGGKELRADDAEASETG